MIARSKSWTKSTVTELACFTHHGMILFVYVRLITNAQKGTEKDWTFSLPGRDWGYKPTDVLFNMTRYMNAVFTVKEWIYHNL